MSPALAGGFLITAPPGKSSPTVFKQGPQGGIRTGTGSERPGPEAFPTTQNNLRACVGMWEGGRGASLGSTWLPHNRNALFEELGPPQISTFPRQGFLASWGT